MNIDQHVYYTFSTNMENRSLTVFSKPYLMSSLYTDQCLCMKKASNKSVHHIKLMPLNLHLDYLFMNILF